MMTSKQSLFGVAALFALAATQACGSDDNGGGNQQTAGAPGNHAGAAGAPAAGAPAGGAPAAGAPAAGAPAAGAPAAGAPSGGAPSGGAGAGGGATGGAGGASGAAGGHAGGAGGAGGASGGAGGGGNTFAAVKTLIGMSCGTGQCHNAASMQLDFQGTADLHGLLTKPIPASIPHCNGSTLAVAGDANSLIVRVTMGATMCMEGGQMKNLAKMPDNCTGNKCLSAAQLKILTDWIAAGAPM